MPSVLTEAALAAALHALPGWQRAGNAIRRTFTFRDFAAAFAFMTDVAREAERLDHHPDWRNSWATVEVALTTHSAGGVTALDLQLARAIDAAATAHGARPPAAC